MKLYNTLTRKKEDFKPIKENEVSMYNCGPTVYDYIHVGNARPLVVFDTMRRFFIYKGYDVKFVVNFTDIDDKIIKKANDENTSLKVITERYIEAFLEDAKGLNLYDYETINPRATEYIGQMIDFIQGLVDKDAAYEVDGNVYFNIDRAKDYGKLSKKNIEDLVSGARIEVNQDKRNPMDFVLWKAAKPEEPFWDSPWGNGRPGWHIECSVMAKSILGDTIDIHSGGEDLQFPHHENEIAQSETLTGKTFANFWLHNGMITIDNKKMSKSEGNFFTIKEVSKEYDLEVLRLFLLSAHYRTPINFSREVMDHTRAGLERLYNGKKNLEYLRDKSEEKDLDEKDKDLIKTVENYKNNFVAAMDDDLNTADATAALFDLVRFANSNLTEGTNKVLVEKTYDIFMELARVLGLLTKEEELLDEHIQDLIDKRSQARKDRDFKLADEIRDSLLEKGIVLEDTKDGVKWKRV